MYYSRWKIFIFVIAILVVIGIWVSLGFYYLENRRLEEQIKKPVLKTEDRKLNEKDIISGLERGKNSFLKSLQPGWQRYNSSVVFQYPQWMMLGTYDDGGWQRLVLRDKDGNNILVEIGESEDDHITAMVQNPELEFSPFGQSFWPTYRGIPKSKEISDKSIVYVLERKGLENIWIINHVREFERSHIPDEVSDVPSFADNLVQQIVLSVE